MFMELIMMSIMHFVTERTESCHPYGVQWTCVFVFLRGLHCISSPFSIRRPYGTVSHGVTEDIRRVMKRSEIPACNNRDDRAITFPEIPACNNRDDRAITFPEIPACNNRDDRTITCPEIPACNNRDNRSIIYAAIPQDL